MQYNASGKTRRLGVNLKLVTHSVVDAYGDQVRFPDLSGTPAWVLGFPLARHDSDPDSSRNCALGGAPSRAIIFVHSLGGVRGLRSGLRACVESSACGRTFESHFPDIRNVRRCPRNVRGCPSRVAPRIETKK